MTQYPRSQQFYSHPERELSEHALPDAEVFFNDEPSLDPLLDEQGELLPRGWYYWFCFPGCMPDSEPIGPFETEQSAIDDCRDFADCSDEILRTSNDD